MKFHYRHVVSISKGLFLNSFTYSIPKLDKDVKLFSNIYPPSGGFPPPSRKKSVNAQTIPSTIASHKIFPPIDAMKYKYGTPIKYRIFGILMLM